LPRVGEREPAKRIPLDDVAVPRLELAGVTHIGWQVGGPPNVLIDAPFACPS
jgi:hypothetical protein